MSSSPFKPLLKLLTTLLIFNLAIAANGDEASWTDAPGVAVFDFDRDGDLDLYMSNSDGMANHLYSNQLNESGKNQWIDVATATGVAAQGQDSSGVCAGDLDNDGYPELLVLSQSGDHRLFENHGQGANRSFVDISDASGVATGVDSASSGGAISCSIGDIDGDGWLDLVLGNSSERTTSGLRSEKPSGFHPVSRVLLNQGGHTFLDATGAPPMKMPALPTIDQALALVDIDQDGDVDWIRAVDPIRPAIGAASSHGTLQVLLNDARGIFTPAKLHTDQETGIVGGAKDLTFADLNHDGRLDFQASTQDPSEARWFLQRSDGSFAEQATAEPMETITEDAESRARLIEVEVIGSFGLTPGGRVNRDGIGAIVRCTPEGQSPVLLPVLSASSYSAPHRRIQSCALADSTHAVVEVLWPGGVRNRIYDVTAGQYLVIPEIPCSSKDPELSRSGHADCVQDALEDFKRAKVVDAEQSQRLLDDALRAYDETQRDETQDDETQRDEPQGEKIEVAIPLRSSTAVTEIKPYFSSITSDANGPIELKVELNYDTNFVHAPIAVVMHGFSPTGSEMDPKNFNNVRDNAQFLRDAGFFAISVAMRGRDGSEGVRDSGGLEIYDIIDAVEYVKAAFPALVDADNVHITGYSGGGGNVMSALTKFPDYFRLGSSFFGMSDYGFDWLYRWWDHGAGGGHKTILTNDVGVPVPAPFPPGTCPDPGASASIQDRYAARASNRASKNNPYSEIHLFVNSTGETISPPLHHQSYHDLADGNESFTGEFDNITLHIGEVDGSFCVDFDDDDVDCEFGEVQSWEHGFPSDAEQLAAENWYRDRLLPGCENLPAGCIPQPVLNARDELYVAGYVKTKPFLVWLGDGQDAARELNYHLRDNIKEFSLGIPDNETNDGCLFQHTLPTEGRFEIDTSSWSGQILRTKINDQLAGEFVGGAQAVYTLQDDEKLQIHVKGDPIVHWKLNETSGTTAVDSSGNGNDGTLIGPSTTVFDFSTKSVSGRVGWALEFDGDDDVIELDPIDSNNPLMLADSDFSIAVWIHQPDDGGDGAQRIVEKSDGTSNAGNGYALWVDKYFIGVSVDGATRAKTANPGLVDPDFYGRWNHLAVTMTADSAHIYINGVDQTSLGVHDPFLPPESDEPMNIGSWTKSTGGREFRGAMDDLKIFNYALTADEVDELQSATPVAHWKLDETIGLLAMDSGDFDNDGDLSGTTFDLSTEPGKVGQALNFDGDDDLIDLGSIGSTNPLMLANSDFSISVWIHQADGLGDLSQRIVEKSNGTGNAAGGYALWIDHRFIGLSVDGTTRLRMDHPGNTDPDFYGRWNHLAVTMTSQEAHIYINGVDQSLDVDLPLLPPDSVQNMRIGSWTKSSGGREFKGRMDDLKIFNVALTPAEVHEQFSLPPIGHWGFDETSGTVAGDLSEFRHQGDLVGPSTTAFDFRTKSAPGAVGRALEFDGDDDLIELGLIDSTDPLMLADSPFSISVWINQPDDLGDGAQRLVEKSNGGSNAANGYALWVDEFFIGVSVNGATRLKLPNPGLQDPGFYDSWNHLAVTMTETTGRIYLNGSEVDPLTFVVDDPALPPLAVEEMNIGSWTKTAGGREFKGLLDDLRIYNRVLTASEVSDLATLP